LLQHLLHTSADFFAVLAKLGQVTVQGLKFFFAFLKLLAQPLVIALRRGSRIPRRLQQLYGAINLLFQDLKIVAGALDNHLFHCFQRHVLSQLRANGRSIAQKSVEDRPRCAVDQSAIRLWRMTGIRAQCIITSRRTGAPDPP
jgi:hypothetical protein